MPQQSHRRRLRGLVTVTVALLVALLVARSDAGVPGERHPAAWAARERLQEYLDFPVRVETPVAPEPVFGDDSVYHLAYHLFVTNWGYTDIILRGMDVLDDQGKVLAKYDERDLDDPVRVTLIPLPPRGSPERKQPRRLPSGRTAAVYVWLEVDSLKQIPRGLRHRFSFERNGAVEVAGKPGTQFNGYVLEGADVSVLTEKPLVLGPPLRGGPWRCANGPALRSAHQGVTVWDGTAYNAQRFAIDFQRVDSAGEVMRPEEAPPRALTNADFYGYGAEVLAVASGTVAFVQDGIPDNAPSRTGPLRTAVPLTRETVSGNWVSVEIAKGRYAVYAHLQPGSIKVRLGEKVRRGQVLALVGNSGNSPAPHLHFSLNDGNSALGSDGLPYVFDAIGLWGHATDRVPAPHYHTIPQRQRNTLPTDNAVIAFP